MARSLWIGGAVVALLGMVRMFRRRSTTNFGRMMNSGRRMYRKLAR